jgi:heme-degrading monooxygenase HmoA
MVTAFITFEATDGPGLAATLAQAAPMLTPAKGYRGHRLVRGVELPNRYVLLVDWDQVDDHMAWMGVNESAFLGAIGPFIAGQPDIKHYAPVA